VVVADGGEAPGLVFAGIDPERIGAVREKLPALAHRRLTVPTLKGDDGL
jgi:predicted amidohydrolase